ncbi:MAG: dUTPase [Epsilonproteobacteria bacterium]|nr:dUTPase [Campylobacterota bacterium]
MDRLTTMFQLQQKLNDNTNGINWEDGVTNKGKKISWKRAILVETAELIDSFPWKHWKDISKEIDYNNIEIELVDIWHFIMSEALKAKRDKNITLEELIKTIKSSPTYNRYIKKEFNKKDNFYKELDEIDNFLKVLLCKDDIFALLDSFFNLLGTFGLFEDRLYQLYIGKNILNQFRQDFGYKEGNYKKIWNNKEDNEVMMEILKDNPSISPSLLYQKLKEIYLKL